MVEILVNGSKMLQNIDIDFRNTVININVDYFHIYPFQSGEKFRLHAHPNFEFHYIYSGKGTVGLVDLKSLIKSDDVLVFPGLSRSHHVTSVPEFRLKISREHELLNHCKSFDLEKGCIFINPPWHFHWQKSSKDDPIVEYSFRCGFDLLSSTTNDTFEQLEEYKQIYDLLLASSTMVYPDAFEIKYLFESIFKEAYYKEPGYTPRIKNILQELIISFARYGWDKKNSRYTPPGLDIKKKRLTMISNYIVSNMHRNILIRELAQAHFMSTRSLSRFIKEETGYSIHKYILQLKIDAAIELITKSTYNLSEIAEFTGFNSAFHLSRMIKKSTGKTPKQLR